MNNSFLIAKNSVSGSTLSTTTLFLIGGVAILVILVAMLLVKMRRRRNTSSNAESKTHLEIGIDHAPNGKEYIIMDEGIADSKNGEKQEHAM